MNAAATDGEEETTVKKGNGENGSHSMDGSDPVDAPATRTLPGSNGKSAGVTATDMSSPASVDDSALSSRATTQPAGAEDTVPEELPRKRRGILLGTRPGQAIPAAADDGKSLSWMATQAAKAAKAVKASQLEQAQAWKVAAGMSEDEQSRPTEDDIAALAAGESVAMPGQEPVQPPSGTVPATTEAMPPVEPSQEATTTPRIPPPAARAAAPRVPARMALVLGVLLMFGYTGYRYWVSVDHAASNATATTSDIIESAGPAEEADMMTPPAISVVAVPEHAAGQSTPPAVEAEMAPMSGSASDVQPAPARVADVPEVPAAAAQEAATANIPQPAPANPASAAVPQTWYPSAVPAAPASAAGAGAAASQPPPASAVEADVAASHPTPPSSSISPTAEVDAAASEPVPPPSPAAAVEARVPASQPVTPPPAARPRYPANGYGYYQPPSSWQPYYQPGYQQSPARR